MQPAKTQHNKVAFRYLALGDSYTIGEGVTRNEAFPYQLVAQLSQNGRQAAAPQMIARTGWTTGELQLVVNTYIPSANFDLVTLLIGVNNQYRGYPITQYRLEFEALLQQAITFAGGKANKVVVLSIPDWSVTPFAKNSDRSVTAIASEIDAFNAVNKEEATALGVSYIDITNVSRKAAFDSSLIAADGLHPSGKMYADWAKLITTYMKSSGW